MTELTPETVLSRNDDVLFSRVADGMSLMDIESGKYFHYDETGAAIWALLDGATPVGALCSALQAEYDVDAATCQEQTTAFLAELAQLGLVRVTGTE